MFLCLMVVQSFSLPYIFLLNDYTKIYLSVLLLIDLSVVSSFGLLHKVLLLIFLYMPSSKHWFTFLQKCKVTMSWELPCSVEDPASFLKWLLQFALVSSGFYLFKTNNLVGIWQYCILVLISVLLIINEVEHIFMCVLTLKTLQNTDSHVSLQTCCTRISKDRAQESVLLRAYQL